MFPYDCSSLRESKVYNPTGYSVHLNSHVYEHFMSNYTICDSYNYF